MEAQIIENMPSTYSDHLTVVVRKSRPQLIEERKALLVKKIKNIINELIHSSDEPLKTNFSTYLSEKLNYHYTYLANLFSKTEGTTIENYIIVQKIERVKDLLTYDELSLTEIAYKLHYSSVAHLSNQFKKVTGLTSSDFQALQAKKYELAKAELFSN